MPKVLFNGSFIGQRNTGIGVMAKALTKNLSPEVFTFLDSVNSAGTSSIQIPSNMSPEHGVSGHIKRLLWIQNKIPKIISTQNFDLLLSPLPEAPLFSPVRSIVIAHDLLPLRYPRLGVLLPYYLTYVPAVLHHAEKVICNSNATAKEITSFFKVPQSKIITIKLGFDKSKFYPKNLKREKFFLVLGRHNPHKNLKRVLKAFSSLNNKSFKIKFVGPFDRRYTPQLRSLTKRLGVSHLCEWIDWVSDSERLEMLNTCNSLILASLWEGFGLPALEALACGTSVICSSVGAIPEVVGGMGLYVDPFNVNDIASAMDKCINDSYNQKQAKELGPKYASGFSWEQTAEEIEKLVISIA